MVILTSNTDITGKIKQSLIIHKKIKRIRFHNIVPYFEVNTNILLDCM